MKKRILMLLTVIMIFIIGGCSPNKNEEEQPADDGNTNTQESQITEEDILIEGKYFNLTLPNEWKDKYIFEEIEDEYGYYMGFYEITSNEAEYGGWLFSIAIDENEEFVEPSYNYIGKINIDDKEKSVIVVWPTDVQFTEETAEQYMQLMENAEDVINTIEASEKTKMQKSENIFGDYMLPGSDMRYVKESELEYFDQYSLKIARNEIYARHGLKFKSQDLKDYFISCEWYIESVEDANSISLNKYEKANIELIKKYEK